MKKLRPRTSFTSTVIGIGSCAATILIGSYATLATGADATVSLPARAIVQLDAQFRGEGPSQLLKKMGVEDIATVQYAVPVPMRDGAKMAATIIIPRGQSAVRSPVILIRSPYDPNSEMTESLASKLLPELIRNHYVIVEVNDRGTQWSEGSYRWLKGANNDGYDILEWITKQPWSNAKVGTFGCSSSAEAQPPMAKLNHPAHKAAVAMGAATGVSNVPGYTDQGIFYRGGVPDLSWAAWYLYFGHLHHPQLPPNLTNAERAQLAKSYSPQPDFNNRFFDPDLLYAMGSPEVMGHLPSGDILKAIDAPDTEWNRLIRLTPASPEWSEFDFVREKDTTKVPSIVVDSWYDGFENFPTIKMFEHLSRSSPNQHLLMGGTNHCAMGSETENTTIGDRGIGDARFDFVSTVKAFFDEWLKDIKPAAPLPAVQYYVLNSNHWQSAPAWPPPGTQTGTLYLGSGGHANGLSGDGQLAPKPPTGPQGVDAYVYDPLHPVFSPTRGGSWAVAAAVEQSTIASRQDVLVYTTEAYEHPIRIVGDVDLKVSVSTSVPDTDLMATLVDVYPDGRAYNVTDTALRLRYRDGVERPTLMQPGRIYDVVVRGMVTATDILPGHRLRVQITSSNFPNYERNLNTGGRNYDEAVAHPATIQIHHDQGHASYLEFKTLPVQ